MIIHLVMQLVIELVLQLVLQLAVALVLQLVLQLVMQFAAQLVLMIIHLEKMGKTIPDGGGGIFNIFADSVADMMILMSNVYFFVEIAVILFICSVRQEKIEFGQVKN